MLAPSEKVLVEKPCDQNGPEIQVGCTVTPPEASGTTRDEEEAATPLR